MLLSTAIFYSVIIFSGMHVGKQVNWTRGREWRREREREQKKKEREKAENRKPHREQVGSDFNTWEIGTFIKI